jgi:lipoprotein NlpD
MYFNDSSLIFRVSLILCIILTACTTQQPNYAPVSSNTPTTISSKYPAISSPRPKIPESIEDFTKYHVVKQGDTLYSIGVSSGHGYQRLALWNQIAAPYTIELGQKIQLFNPDPEDNSADKKQQNEAVVAKKITVAQKNPILSGEKKIKTVVKSISKRTKTKAIPTKNRSKSQKKSIISTDNQKVLKLSFQWPIKGKILKNFSESDNKGIDISGKMGQTVYAAEAGKVVYSGQGLISLGNLVIIKHNELYLSAYANNSRLLVAEGQNVEKGQDIAQVGEAVYKKASLHFEIRKNGKSVNPLALLP